MAKGRKVVKRRKVTRTRRIRRTPEQLILDLEKRLADLKSQTLEAKGFTPQAIQRERARLQLSAADYAQLLGVTPLTIYNWEKGRSRPRAAQLDRWSNVKGISKREAWKRLGYT